MSLSYWFVPHTHWDREWYLSFQNFRWRLVPSIDSILDTLQAEPRFKHFMLDGQTILLEDYLELRPERREELEKLITAGRIAVGPWYVQPDDILVTGEALVRNLERGIRIAREFGGAMKVGYLPDSFGHCAALPSILRGFGIESAALMRGGGPELDKVFFTWTGRDGSRVLVAHLIDSYGNGADLDLEPSRLKEGLEILRDRQADALLPHVPLLVLNGMDHRSISVSLPAAIEGSGLRDICVIGSLGGYIAAAEHGLSAAPEWTGELRSAWRFPITVGCTSTRHWIKQEDQAVAALLEREAEPLAAMASWRGARYPRAAIDLAWKHLLQNQPHDSICGCSIDEVHDDMRYRYAQARGIGTNVAADAAAALAAHVDSSFAGHGQTVAVAVNPGPSRRSALLSVAVAELPADPVLVDRGGRRYPVQLLSQEGGSAVFFDERFTPRQLTFAMGMVREGKILEFSVQSARSSWESPSVLRIDLELAPRGFSRFDWDSWVRATTPLLGTPGLTHVHAVGLRSGIKTVIFSADLPSFGARAFHVTAAGGQEPPAGEGGAPALRAGRGFIENRRFRIRVLRDGSLEVMDKKLGQRLRGINRIVDDGDRGDEYNHDSPPRDRLIRRPAPALLGLRRVHTAVVESGPVRAALRISATYRLPSAVSADRGRRDRGRVNVDVVRVVSLLAEGERIEFRTEIDNQARDHRMRAHFPLPVSVPTSLAGGTFGAVSRPARPIAVPEGRKRPVSPELGEEQPPATHPFTGFVSTRAPGLCVAVLARGLREYEILDNGGSSTIALTLFRSVGWLSRADLAQRRGNAGPDTPTPGAQEIGRHYFEYALVTGEAAAAEDALFREWEDYRVSPPVLLKAAAPGSLADGEGFLEIGDPMLVFSSLRRVGEEAFSFRAFDAGGTERIVEVRLARGVSWARKTRIDGTPVGDLDVEHHGEGAAVRVPVRPWEIITVEFGGSA